MVASIAMYHDWVIEERNENQKIQDLKEREEERKMKQEIQDLGCIEKRKKDRRNKKKTKRRNPKNNLSKENKK